MTTSQLCIASMVSAPTSHSLFEGNRSRAEWAAVLACSYLSKLAASVLAEITVLKNPFLDSESSTTTDKGLPRFHLNTSAKSMASPMHRLLHRM